jgi:hypothetical protein
MIAASIIGIFTISMLAAGRIAQSRGRSMRAWIWLAFGFGPFAALAAWVLPVKPAPNQLATSA